VSIFRLNFSHGTLETHAQTLRRIREVAADRPRQVAVLGDLQGPKVRVGRVEAGGVRVEPGDRVIFQRDGVVASPDDQPLRLSSTYERLIDDVNVGERVLINDGAIRMLTVEKTAETLECTVTVGGRISSGKGINLPESNISAPALTERDVECVAWTVEHEVDVLALSFVRSARELNALRAAIREQASAQGKGDDGLRLPIIAKIELPTAVEHIESILEAADGIMVARGDLGVEMELARVPVIQKRLIEASHAAGKPCIVATQMLESMIDSPTPTRAEASDVATAIFARVDAVMLSGETAVGKFPVLAVEYMRQIAAQTEGYVAEQPATPSPPAKPREERYRTAALAHGVWTIAQDYGARVVVVWSQTGGGARLLSQNEFCIPIVAISSDERAVRQMQLLRGVFPVRFDLPEDLSAFTARVDEYLLEHDIAERGDPCILVAGSPLGVSRNTNSLAIHEVGNPDTGFARHESKAAARVSLSR